MKTLLMTCSFLTFALSFSCSREEKDLFLAKEIVLEGAYNVRDLGGYKTKDGKRVKRGRLFRAGDLNKLTKSDLALLNSLGIKTFIDLRSPSEIILAKDREPESLVYTVLLPMDLGNLSDTALVQDEKKARDLMKEMNVLFIKNFASTFQKFFSNLLDQEKAPLLFHCSAGKDRTGILAALTLASLGVEKETIFKDYLLSNKYLGDKYLSLVKENPANAALYSVEEEYLEAAFDYIEEEYSSVENYLKLALSLDVERLKALYLE